MLDRIAELLIFGFAPLVVGLLIAPGVPEAAEHVLAGEVLYRERIALPPNAVVSVQLADVSLADAPAAIVGEQTVEPAGQVPVKFAIRFDPSVIQTGMSYALQARITVDDKLWFITDTRHDVDPLTDEPQTVVVKKVDGQAQEGSAGFYGRDWKVDMLDGIAALPERRATFRIEEDGRIGGKGFCNGYFASAEVDGDAIEIGRAGATQMACAQDLMAADAALFDAFEKAATLRADGEKLVIGDKDGREIVRFIPL